MSTTCSERYNRMADVHAEATECEMKNKCLAAPLEVWAEAWKAVFWKAVFSVCRGRKKASAAKRVGRAVPVPVGNWPARHRSKVLPRCLTESTLTFLHTSGPLWCRKLKVLESIKEKVLQETEVHVIFASCDLYISRPGYKLKKWLGKRTGRNGALALRAAAIICGRR